MGDELIIEKTVEDLKRSIKKELGNLTISSDDNLIEKGLSSIQIMKLSGNLRKAGFRIPFSELMRNPKMGAWKHLIRSTPVRLSKKDRKAAVTADPHKEFPITDVQYAYFIGREDDQTLGGIGCHAYLEIDGEGIRAERLNDSWNTVQQQNAMLRARFNENGTQQILETPYSVEIEVYDFRQLSGNKLDEELLGIRSLISHRKLNVKEGQVAGLSLALLPDNKNRIFLDVDLLVADVMSISILINQLSEVYSGEAGPANADFTFKDYLSGRNIDEASMNADKEFWREKISSFPKGSPELPLKKKPEQIEKVVFTRRKRTLDSGQWDKIKRKAAAYKVTPSMVLLTCYSMIIERWINQDSFVINMPLFNRDINNEYVSDMIADFTNLLLIECERKSGETVLGKIRRMSETFLDNAAHSSYSGVKVLRDLHKEAGENANIAPIVFACNIDYPLETEKTRKVLGKLTYMISQTPQVWLDFQTFVNEGALYLCWDAVDELYYDGMLDDMMDSLYHLLITLSERDNWDAEADVLTDRQKAERKRELECILPLKFPDRTLISGFIDRVNSHPGDTAVIDPETGARLTYKELYDRSFILSNQLIKSGVAKNAYVGITLPRGYRQIIGLFAILFAGGAYVSIGANQPKERRNKIYNQIGITHVLTDHDTIRKISLDEDGVRLIDMDSIEGGEAVGAPVEIDPFDTAYVIMTSGTTGTPKGVEIAHNSAVNTINDINDKYKISSQDAMILVSSIDFDLSVYDIFGMLSVGGSIVVLNESNFKDPDLWIHYINKYRVTVWDSVPILFDMLVTMAEGKNMPLPLRAVLLSGDWISITLPERFYRLSSGSLVVGMGGATEASIWSNYIDIPKVLPRDWKTIPYGRALKNQVYRVVDDLGRICPNYVTGELYIGGVGVAKGYRGDRELTDSKFVELDGIRWYKTGDTGRFWNDGTIEFLGRKDNQVKIRGHRIELGEIEAAVLKNKYVKNVVVEIIELARNNQIVVFVEPKKEIDGNLRGIDLQLKAEIDKTKDEFEDYGSYLKEQNHSVVRFLFHIFKELGLWEENNSGSMEDILSMAGISRDYKELMLNWASILEKNRMLTAEEAGGTAALSCAEVSDGKEETNGIPHQELLKNELLKILKGKKNPIDVFYGRQSGLSPVDYLRGLRNYDQNARRLTHIVRFIRSKLAGNLRILEFAGRDRNFTESLLRTCKNELAEYVYCDNTLYFKDEFRELESSEPAVFKYRVADVEAGRLEGLKDFDLVIFYNSIHRFKDIAACLKVMKGVIRDGGFLLGTEIHSGSLLSNVTAGALLKGFYEYELDKRGGSIIPDTKTMKGIFEDSGLFRLYLSDEDEVERTGKLIFAGQKPESLFSSEELEDFLKARLPEYMLPHKIIKIEQLPLNKNGKVDRKKLKGLFGQLDSGDGLKEEESGGADNKTTELLIGIWKKLLEKESVKANSNYFQAGGDSLMATRLASQVKACFGVEISVGDVFANPVLKDLSDFIDKKGKAKPEFKRLIEPDYENINEPFNMTEVQFAYWIGRSGAYSLSSVSTHCYYELDCTGVEVTKLQRIINDMIRDHAMLRAVILKNGKQQILKETPPYVLEINNISCFDEAAKENILQKLRKEMSHEVIATEAWPLFHFKVSLIDERKLRFHIGFDNLILDGWSMFQLLKEIRQRYDDDGFTFEQPAVSFRDYVLAITEMKETRKYMDDKNYWLDRLEHFLNPPKFKQTKPESQIQNQIFSRREKVIGSDRWLQLKKLAQENEITPTIMLIALFSEALLKFTQNDEFALNITQFNREQIHQDINKIVGDFTTLTFLEIRRLKAGGFIHRARNIQKQLGEDMDHRLYSAIEFGRELRLKRGNEQESLMPIVFTSGLGLNSQSNGNWIGDIAYSISQTPQVWLDHQVTEENGELKLVWDSVDEIFPPGLLDDMFHCYFHLVEDLADGRRAVTDDFSDLRVTGREEACFSGEPRPKPECGSTGKGEENPVVYLGKHKDLYGEIMSIWGSVLGTELIDYNKNFIELGGNSLNIIQMSNLLLDKYGYSTDIIKFMDNPTINYLVGEISGIAAEKG